MNKKFDLNMDCGEELAGKYEQVDQIMMPLLTYCNIACGFHAGTNQSMKDTVQLAIENEVKIGAHPSFDDRLNFGRVYIDMSMESLTKIIIEQIETLEKILGEKEGSLYHVKAHGALYNSAMQNDKEARAIVESVKRTNPEYVIFCMVDSKLSAIANSEGLKVSYECFADRNYSDYKTLVSRAEVSALQNNEDEIVGQMLRLKEGKLKVLDGKVINIKCDTICLHSDHPLIFKTYERLKTILEHKNLV
jgi:5-oxoprolinase (ATP-hydrolysing) subunit A